jgi:hypothetical protein
MTDLYYINKKGKRVELSLTNHAVKRFVERWKKLYDYPMPAGRPEDTLVARFKCATLETPKSWASKRRLKKHPSTLYFKGEGFTFVVENATIVTVEISSKGKRWRN